MTIEYHRLLPLLLICLTIGSLNANGSVKRYNCRDFVGDRSNCQRFIRCFHNLRVLFSCGSNTAYVPDLQTCVAKELVIDCDDFKNRDEVNITSSENHVDFDDYPTIEADLNALEPLSMQKSLSSYSSLTITPRKFGCSSYCYNQGVCVLVGQKITCRCPKGFVGVRCQVAQSALSTRVDCTADPCENGGTCYDMFPATFVCVCPTGYTGEICQYQEPVTVTVPTSATSGSTGSPGISTCSVNPCQNQAECYIVGGSGFVCNCTAGFTGLLCENTVLAPGSGSGSGSGCGTNNLCLTNTGLALANLCQPNPCRNGGSCYLNQTSFACACPTGFTGIRCDTSVAVSNPCYTSPCQNSGTCQVVGTTAYRCVCPVGFIGVRCEQRVCDPNPCLYGGQCLPLGTTFQCQCPAQYTGTCCELLIATTAVPNPCSSNPCLNGGTCSATSTTAYVCSCTPSYYGSCCEVRNYCQPNPCYNGGTCIATVNGYLCQCIYPNSGSNCELTISTIAPRPACQCLLCPCPTVNTVVTNPCLPNPCQNNGGCAAVQNNPQCYCQPAFVGSYCQYQLKRSLTNDLCANVTCLNKGQCYVGENGPECSCLKPYFGKRCELINQPRTCDPNPCGRDGKCLSTDHGYQCVCDPGRTGILCEQILMPKDYRWCPLNCRTGTTCIYEGSTPKCRVLNV